MNCWARTGLSSADIIGRSNEPHWVPASLQHHAVVVLPRRAIICFHQRSCHVSVGSAFDLVPQTCRSVDVDKPIENPLAIDLPKDSPLVTQRPARPSQEMDEIEAISLCHPSDQILGGEITRCSGYSRLALVWKQRM